MRIQLIVPGGHPAKLLEAAEKPFHGMALGIAGCVVWRTEYGICGGME